MNCAAFENTALKNGFLYDKQQLNRKITINAVWDRFYDTGRIDAFKFDWEEGKPNKPHIFWDSDVAKWMEGAIYILAKNNDAALKEKVEWIIDRIEEHQEKSGYFNIFFTVCEKENRFSNRSQHELYCAGHLIEAACAYYETCGEERFLNLMRKYADHIYKVFAEDGSAKFKTPGHEEIELALVRLYKVTGVKKYLDLCMFFLNTRGTGEDIHAPETDNGVYNQSHLPVREQTEAVGHAVRALYLYSAMADAARESGDQELLKACRCLFKDIVNHKMHITGGLGQTNSGEAFTFNYDLKNETAYTETCASIAMIMFCERMFSITHSSEYTDIIERELYNGMISGVSISGNKFFYSNPLEINLNNRKRFPFGGKPWMPITQRVEVFHCSCCPPNINRTLASIERTLYTSDNGEVYINQFAESEYTDKNIKVAVSTDYPNTGKIKVVSENANNIYMRIPGWCKKFELSAGYEMVDGYARVDSDSFTLELDMSTRYMMSNENVADNENKICVTRGPVVYCAEAIDNGAPLHKLYIDVNSAVTVENSEYFGLPVLTLKGFVKRTDPALYSELNDEFEDTDIKLIPYYGFANRDECDMKVWMNYKK